MLGFPSTSDPVPWLRPDELDGLRAWLTEAREVEQLGRLLFRVDGRLVDFGSALGAPASPCPVSTVA